MVVSDFQQLKEHNPFRLWEKQRGQGEYGSWPFRNDLREHQITSKASKMEQSKVFELSTDTLDDPVEYLPSKAFYDEYPFNDDTRTEDSLFMEIPAMKSKINGCEIPAYRPSRAMLNQRKEWEKELEKLPDHIRSRVRSVAAYMGYFPHSQHLQALEDNRQGQDMLNMYQDIWKPWLDDKRPVLSRMFFHIIATKDNFIYRIMPLVNHATAVRYVDCTEDRYFWNTYEFTSVVPQEISRHTTGPILGYDVTSEEQGFMLGGLGYEMPMDFLENKRSQEVYMGHTNQAHESMRMQVEFCAFVRIRQAAAKFMASSPPAPAAGLKEFASRYEKWCEQCFSMNKLTGPIMQEQYIVEQAQFRGVPVDTVVHPPSTETLFASRTALMPGSPNWRDFTPAKNIKVEYAARYPVQTASNGPHVLIDPFEIHFPVNEYFDLGPMDSASFLPQNYRSDMYNTSVPADSAEWEYVNAAEAFRHCGLFQHQESRPFMARYASELFHALVKYGCQKNGQHFNPRMWDSTNFSGYDGIPEECTAGLLYKSTSIYQNVIAKIASSARVYKAFCELHQRQKHSAAHVSQLTKASAVQHQLKGGAGAYHFSALGAMHSGGGKRGGVSALDDALSSLYPQQSGFPSSTTHAPPTAASVSFTNRLTQAAASTANSQSIVLREFFAAADVVPIANGTSPSSSFRVPGKNGPVYAAYSSKMVGIVHSANPQNVYNVHRADLLAQRRAMLPPGSNVGDVTEATVLTDLAAAGVFANRKTSVAWTGVAVPADVGAAYKKMYASGGAAPANGVFLAVLFQNPANVPPDANGRGARAEELAQKLLTRAMSADERHEAMRLIGDFLRVPGRPDIVQQLEDSVPIDTAFASLLSMIGKRGIGSKPGLVAGCSCGQSDCSCPVSPREVETLLDSLRPNCDFFETCLNAGVPPPARLRLLRRGQWKVSSSVFMKSGIESMFTVVRKMEKLIEKAIPAYNLYVWVRSEFACIVHEPKNLYYCPYSKSSRYLHGMGTNFYTMSDAEGFKNGDVFQDKDFWVFLLPIDYKDVVPVMDWSGEINHTLMNSTGTPLFPTARVYAEIWGLRNGGGVSGNDTLFSLSSFNNSASVVDNYTLFGRGRQTRMDSTGKFFTNSTSAVPYGPDYDPADIQRLKTNRECIGRNVLQELNRPQPVLMQP